MDKDAGYLVDRVEKVDITGNGDVNIWDNAKVNIKGVMKANAR